MHHNGSYIVLIVPNHSSFSFIPIPNTTYFIVIDFKDAFFTVPLNASSQDLFAFRWIYPSTITSLHPIRTVLLRGLGTTPHFLGQALSMASACGPYIAEYVDGLGGLVLP